MAPQELPITGVTFKTSDAFLQRLFDAAEAGAAGNIVQFTPGMKALVEGPTYQHLFLETQPMGGEMYAKRDLRIALNNQLIFLMNQREDGRLPAIVRSGAKARERGWDKPERIPAGVVYRADIGMCPDYRHLQGHYLATSALKMYFLAGRDRDYLRRVQRALEAFDGYLWRTRDSDGNGVLESWCAWDTGEDLSIRYSGAPDDWRHDYPPAGEHTPDPADPVQLKAYWPQTNLAGGRPRKEQIRVPYQSMDLMAFSFDSRRVLARISSELGDGREQHWKRAAEDVRRRAIEHLWRPERHAFYDRDKDDRYMDVLLHNNLRVMYFGLPTRAMADAFIRRHLLNPAEFWTPMPLPSIAANDPLFRNVYRQFWSGQPMSLTFQRAIRALENYGHYAEVPLIGEKLIANLGKTCRFPQQFDAFTGAHCPAPHSDGYGPAMLAVLEYISRMHGVYRDEDRIHWSGLARPGYSTQYTQRWGATRYTLRIDGISVRGLVDDVEMFRCASGVRVVTDLNGAVLEVIGLDRIPREILLSRAGRKDKLLVKPNQVWRADRTGKLVLGSSAPFDFRPRDL